MNVNIFSRPFVKDGLIGLSISFLVFAILLAVSLSFRFPSFHAFWGFIEALFVFPKSLSIANGQRIWHVLFSPMPLIILVTFLAVGSSGRSLENITSRLSWVKPIMLLVLKTWLSAAIFWPLLLVMIVRFWIGSEDDLYDSVIISLIFGAVGMVIGLLIGCLAGCFFNPSERLFRLVIGAIASICVSYTMGAGILLVQWAH